MDKYLLVCVLKLVVFSSDGKSVLLCRRVGEKDYDGVFSFIGGKMETTDEDLIDAMGREKAEEVGENFRVLLYPTFSWTNRFVRKDGYVVVLPHYYAKHLGGDIDLSDEYSEYKWVEIEKLRDFEPKIQNIPVIVERMIKLSEIIDKNEMIEI